MPDNRSINDLKRSIARLTDENERLHRENTRLRALLPAATDTYRPTLSLAPKVKGALVTPNTPGYITWVEITGMGRHKYELTDSNLALVDAFILGIALNAGKAQLQAYTKLIDKAIATYSHLKTRAMRLERQGLITLTYTKEEVTNGGTNDHS